MSDEGAARDDDGTASSSTPTCPASPAGSATTWSSTHDGNAYVGNFGFDLFGGEQLRDRRPHARADPTAPPTVVADGLKFPNGSVITPDGRR